MGGSPLPPGRSGSVRKRLAAVCAAALLAIGLAPAAGAQAARTPVGRAADRQTAEPGAAVAWGANTAGELGDGATTQLSTTPVGVCGGSPCPKPFDQVVAADGDGEHNVALRSDGSVWTWGSNIYGELGDGTTTGSTTPVPVCAVGQTAPCTSFLTGVSAVAAGFHYTLALRTNGTVVAWGANGVGQLGNGTNTSSSVPVVVSDILNVASIAAGDSSSLAAMTDGTVRSWGLNSHGQLGDGTNVNRNVPVYVCASGATSPCGSVLSGVTALAGGGTHSLARRTDSTVVAWGANSAGQLGNGSNTDSSTPVQVSGLTGVTSVGAGYAHSLAAKSDGTVRSWGANDRGQLGDGTDVDKNAPAQVCAPGKTAPCTAFLTGIATVSGGFGHSVALRTDGTVRSWGANGLGQLGDGTTASSTVPVRVCAAGETAPCARLLDGVGFLNAGDFHTVATTHPSADVAISLRATPNPVAPNGNLTYTVTVRNNGPSAAENVVFDDTLPAEGEFVSASPSQGSCVVPPTGSTDTVTCKLGVLAANTSRATTIVVTVRAAAGTTVTDRAKVTSTTADPNPVNNSVTVRTRVG
ncbi:RCC1 domain-containing protein [Streptomyces sp. NPDC003943]